jgi:hypothetical protein
MYTPYHSLYWATALTLRGSGGSMDRLSQSIANAKVDLNPHHVDAALFALRSPLSKGAALVEEFRDRKTLLIATESAAEGVNLQFCSLVVNYDLPWNPQRIEQRIGRCDRYGQKHDVVVVNFLNRRNAADQRVFQLLSQKFRLFDGIFGSSDEVLGALESGVDLEKRIAQVYQECRTPTEIEAAFDQLQAELDETIGTRLAETRRVLLENFDEEVHARMRVHREQAIAALSTRQRWLLELTTYLENIGTLGAAHRVANHGSPRTTTVYGPRLGEISLDEVERIAIYVITSGSKNR